MKDEEINFAGGWMHILTTRGKCCSHYFKTLFSKQHFETAKTAQASDIGY